MHNTEIQSLESRCLLSSNGMGITSDFFGHADSLVPSQRVQFKHSINSVGQGPKISSSTPFTDDNAIARWNMVPWQEVDGLFNIGVMAYHADGMSHVTISAEEQQWVINEEGLNPLTNTMEFFARIDSSTLSSGAVTFNATAFPINGVPRQLDPITIWVGPTNGPVRYVSPNGNDANDGLTPETPKRDPAMAIVSMADTNRVVPAGATLYMLPGEHVWIHPAFPDNLTTQAPGPWLKIRSMSGDAVFNSDTTVEVNRLQNGEPYMLSLNKVKWQGVTFRNENATGPIPYMTTGAQVWYDGIVLDGIDRFNQMTSFAWGESTGGRYLTNSLVKEVVESGTGFNYIRNTKFQDTMTGGPWGAQHIVNVQVDHIGRDADVTLVMDSTDNRLVIPTGVNAGFGTVGRTLEITGGNGWTPGNYTIESAENEKWRLSASPAPAGTTGGVGIYRTGAHPDVWRSWGAEMNNIILYGLVTPQWDQQTASLGMVFFTTHGTQELSRYNDIAVINSYVSSGGGIGTAFGFGGIINNMIIRDSEFRGAVYIEQPANRQIDEMLIERSVFRIYDSGELFVPNWPAEVTVRN